MSKRYKGFTREEISKSTGIPYGGGLTKTLKALIESDFVMEYIPFGETARKPYYKLVDNFCLFWIKYVEQNANDKNFLNDNITSSIMDSWKGIAFQELCWQHLGQIRTTLGISGVQVSVSGWAVQGDDTKHGAQIDLLIDRKDNIINLCEMKFCMGKYSIDAEEEEKLRNRIEHVKSRAGKKTVHLTFVTTNGVAYGRHSGIVQKEITLDDLFGE